MKYGRILLLALAAAATLLLGTTEVSTAPAPDASNQWVSLNGPPGAFVADIAVHPSNPDILFAAVDGGGVAVYKSTDGGATWDESAQGVTSPYGWKIHFAPADPTGNTLYVTTWRHGLFRTTDGGMSWQFVEGTPHRHAWSLAFGRNDPDIIYLIAGYAAGTDAVYKSSDSGLTWSVLKTDIDPWSIATAPDDDDLVYVGTWDVSPRVIYHSDNGGTDWTILTSGLPDANINDIVPIGDGSVVYAATDAGVYKSTDSGDNWAAVSSGLTNLFVRDLEVNPGDDQTLYAATDNSVSITTDGAGDWQPFGTGLTTRYAKSIKVDPSQTSHLFAAIWDGVCERTGSGDWSCSNTGFPSVAPVAAGSLAVKPAHPFAMLAGTYGGGVYRTNERCPKLPWEPSSHGIDTCYMNPNANMNPWTEDYVYTGTDGGGVYRSPDGGLTWEAIGPTTANMTEIAIGNTPNVVYVATREESFWSGDYGDSWTLISSLPYGASAFAFHPDDDNMIYATSWADGVFRSTDGGSTWEPMNAGLSGLQMLSLVIDPNDPEVLYAGTWGTGVFKSTDGGGSWFDISDGFALTDSSVHTLLISPAYPDTVYAGTESDGVFRSVDGGVTWWSWNQGLLPEALDISALVPDPSDGRLLYIGTNTGVYRRSDGIPVGGIVELPAGPPHPAAASDSSATDYAGPVAAAVAAGALALVAGGWYASRRVRHRRI